MQILINKINLALDSSQPYIFYTHSQDESHLPVMTFCLEDNNIVCYSTLLLKIKKNIQTKQRIDIYVKLSEFQSLAKIFSRNFSDINSQKWIDNEHNPNSNKLGNMELPKIHDSFRSTLNNITIRIGGVKDNGILLKNNNSDIYLEVESPAKSHIMMKEKEVHIGIRLKELSGKLSNSWQYNVPYSELRSTTNEQNPLNITYAHMKMTFSTAIFKGAIEAIHHLTNE